MRKSCSMIWLVNGDNAYTELMLTPETRIAERSLETKHEFWNLRWNGGIAGYKIAGGKSLYFIFTILNGYFIAID